MLVLAVAGWERCPTLVSAVGGLGFQQWWQPGQPWWRKVPVLEPIHSLSPCHHDRFVHEFTEQGLGWMWIEDVWCAQVHCPPDSREWLCRGSFGWASKRDTNILQLQLHSERSIHTFPQTSMLPSPEHILTKSQVLYHPAKSLATCLSLRFPLVPGKVVAM